MSTTASVARKVATVTGRRRASGLFEPMRKAAVQIVQHRMMTDEEKQEWAATVTKPWQIENGNLLSQITEERKQRMLIESLQSKLQEKINTLEVDLKENQSVLARTRESLEQLSLPVHPTYGALLAQSGNRRVFATCPKRIINKELFPAYHSQRSFRPERAETIAASIRKDDRFNGFPGMISMFELVGEAAAETRGNQVRGIVDGQHRVGAIEKLLTSGHWPEDRKVITEVYSVSDPADAARLFLQINKMQPVLDVDMVPIQAAIAESTVNGLVGGGDEGSTATGSGELTEERLRIKDEVMIKTEVDACVARLERMFPNMFKESPKCRPPHVHADTLRDILFKNAEARASAKKGADAMMAFIMSKNQSVKQSLMGSSAANATGGTSGGTATSKIQESKEFAKANTNGFYLGMSKSWY